MHCNPTTSVILLPVFTEKLVEALQNETGVNAESFRVRRGGFAPCPAAAGRRWSVTNFEVDGIDGPVFAIG